MKQPTLLHSLLSAAALTFSASLLLSVSQYLRWSPFPDFGLLFLGLLYLGCLALVRPGRAGVLTVFLLAGTVQLAGAAAGTRLVLLIPLLCLTFTAVRAVCWHRYFRHLAADLLLSGVACLLAGWCLITFGSVPLSVWCFFLVQGGWVFLLRDRREGRAGIPRAEKKKSARFAEAYAAALKVLQ